MITALRVACALVVGVPAAAALGWITWDTIRRCFE